MLDNLTSQGIKQFIHISIQTSMKFSGVNNLCWNQNQKAFMYFLNCYVILASRFNLHLPDKVIEVKNIFPYISILEYNS